MKHKIIEIKYSEYNSIDDLNSDDATLVNKAREASKNGWAPYSNFHVGAAVLLDSGKIILGNNQENAAYPSGLCAERVAMYAANANYPHDRVVAIAISAYNIKGALEQPVSPCGSCRQAMLETEERFGVPIRIILDGVNYITLIEGIRNMLPLSFGKDSL